MKRILVYSHDTFGLGNIRRMLEVARHLVQASPSVSVLVLTGSPMLHAFRLPERIDYVKLPCLARDVDGRYGARNLPLSLDETVRLRANLIRSAVSDFAPDLVLVDKKPFGVEDELATALAAPPAGQVRPRRMLLLRDILDSPEATRHVWRKNGYYEAVSTHYDEVLVVGSPEVFDLRREYAFPPAAAAKVRYCGYIARSPGRRTRSQLRRALGVPDEAPMWLATPGGGADGFDLVERALEAAPAVHAATGAHLHVVCGPEMDEARRGHLHRHARALPAVSVADFDDDMMSLQGAADVVLAMGGYNTVCELLSMRRRAVLVPRERPGVEQLLRAERLAALGLVRLLRCADLNAGTLALALQAELAAVSARLPLPALPPMDGLSQVGDAVFGALGLDEAVAPPPRRIDRQVAAC